MYMSNIKLKCSTYFAGSTQQILSEKASMSTAEAEQMPELHLMKHRKFIPEPMN